MSTTDQEGTGIIALRWIAFLPAAVVGAVVGYFLHRVSILMIGGRLIPIFDEVLAVGLAGFAFVLAGTFVAPSSKRRVAAVLLAVLFVAINVFVGVVAVAGGTATTAGLIGSLGAPLGAGIGLAYGLTVEN